MKGLKWFVNSSFKALFIRNNPLFNYNNSDCFSLKNNHSISFNYDNNLENLQEIPIRK